MGRAGPAGVEGYVALDRRRYDKAGERLPVSRPVDVRRPGVAVVGREHGEKACASRIGDRDAPNVVAVVAVIVGGAVLAAWFRFWKTPHQPHSDPRGGDAVG
jgi:hypothetical protein